MTEPQGKELELEKAKTKRPGSMGTGAMLDSAMFVSLWMRAAQLPGVS